MKQLHTTALGRGWKRKGHILTKSPSSAPFTGLVIRPSGWPFVAVNICLLVYLSAYSGKEIVSSCLFQQHRSLSCGSIYRVFGERRRVQETGGIDIGRSKVKAQPGGHRPVVTEEVKWQIKNWICRGLDWWDFRQKTEYSNLENGERGRERERAKISMMGQAREYQLQKL